MTNPYFRCLDCGCSISRYSTRCQKCEGIRRFNNKSYRENQSLKNKGQKRSVEAKQKMSLSQKERFEDINNHPRYGKVGCVGKSNGNYKDGRTSLIFSLRHCKEYEQWRDLIFKRDEYTCQDCGQVGYSLEAHHKKSFRVIFEEFIKEYSYFSVIEDKETLYRIAINYKPFWELENGITVCEKCHKLNYTTRPEKISNNKE